MELAAAGEKEKTAVSHWAQLLPASSSHRFVCVKLNFYSAFGSEWK